MCDLIYIKIRLFINGGSTSLRLQTIDCTALDRWAGMCGEVLGEIWWWEIWGDQKLRCFKWERIVTTTSPSLHRPLGSRPRAKLWLFAATNSTIFVNNNNIYSWRGYQSFKADLAEIYFSYVVTFGSPESRRQLFCLNNCTATSPEKLEWEWKLIKQLPWTNQLHWAVTGPGSHAWVCWELIRAWKRSI